MSGDEVRRSEWCHNRNLHVVPNRQAAAEINWESAADARESQRMSIH